MRGSGLVCWHPGGLECLLNLLNLSTDWRLLFLVQVLEDLKDSEEDSRDEFTNIPPTTPLHLPECPPKALPRVPP